MTPQPVPPTPRLQSSLPIVAVVFSVLGFCLPPLLLVGIILGIIALVQNKGSLAAGIVAVVLPVTAIPIVGILAAIAIPNFIKFQARSKQSECKMNLKAAYIAEKAYFAEHDVYDMHPATVGFRPEKGNRYLYVFNGSDQPAADSFIAPDAKFGNVLYEEIPAGVREQLGPRGKCPECSITIGCAGNIDTDATLDVWTISTENRPGAPAGTPFNDVSDLTD